MLSATIISADELAQHLGDPDVVVVDCRFSLNDTERGRREYAVSHIPGAVYAHLDEDLSAPVVPGQTGRHPLPEPEDLAARFAAWGIGDDTQVVAYDDNGGMMAARLWWVLRWLGHDAVAVLDGSWQGWLAAGKPTTEETPTPAPREFTVRLRPQMAAPLDEVRRISSSGSTTLVDSRAADRYRGENETIDPKAGHIPGASNLPYAGNLDANGHFLTPAALKERFTDVLGDVPPEQAVFYCGSGVSAAHNVLGAAHAGLGLTRLYPGSWSEWITDPNNPIATGAAKRD